MSETLAEELLGAPATAAAVHDRIMLDSTSWEAVHAAVKQGQVFRGLKVSLAAGYLDGRYAWPAAAWAELEAAGISAHEQVGITVFGSGGQAMKARAGDSEPGDMTPAKVAGWAKAEHDAGHWPVPYCDRAWKPQIIAECRKLGLEVSKDYGLWVATLDGTLTDTDGRPLRDQPGVVAIQYEQARSPIHQAGQQPDLDVSLVVSTAWRAAKAAAVKHEYIVVRLPDGASSKMLSGMTLK
jgi:hypothetical protein